MDNCFVPNSYKRISNNIIILNNEFVILVLKPEFIERIMNNQILIWSDSESSFIVLPLSDNKEDFKILFKSRDISEISDYLLTNRNEEEYLNFYRELLVEMVL